MERTICNNLGRRKWTFILYLAIHKKLYTTDRPEEWGICNDVLCPLCSKKKETHQHLFFKCTEVGKIWQKMLQWMFITRGSQKRNEEVTWATKYKNGHKPENQLYRMALTSMVYHMWQERNQRIFQKRNRSIAQITDNVSRNSL